MEKVFKWLNRYSFAMLCAIRHEKSNKNDYKVRQVHLMHPDWALTLNLIGQHEVALRTRFNQSQDKCEKEAIHRELIATDRIRKSFSHSIEFF
jgi:hypothetical protein